MPWLILKVMFRDISKACSYSKSTVWNILHTYGAYPYRPVLAQELMPGGQDRRFDLCNFVLNTLDENPDFLNEVLWSDECHFPRQGTIDTQNRHYWSLENLHLIRPNRRQERWSVNVWCGKWKSTLIGPIYFDVSLTSESYTEILSGPLADFLEDEVSLRDLSRMWYQHDGAPAHRSVQPCTFLEQTFDTRIIGYGGQEVAEATGGVSDASLLFSCSPRPLRGLVRCSFFTALDPVSYMNNGN
ncbi:uncharacterized protein TNCV_2840321 [Trichonephila clavipes]|uniref:Transposase n=1 Tax=Trichonephila clavipes TaxID=2585209 RepID=A0A8X6V776_TRICX|nr:uncharacterized protein TNCV_2840321 [Trichonephila clavipes]